MRILFASPDRDLLRSYRTILEAEFGEVRTIFDGTQVPVALTEEVYDLAIVDRRLPRVSHVRILGFLKEAKIPVLALTDEPLSPALLGSDPLADEYLAFPFLPEELTVLIKELLAAKEEDMATDFGAALTLKEYRLISALRKGERVDTKEAALYAASVNLKLAKLGRKARIRYKKESGFEWVDEDE